MIRLIIWSLVAVFVVAAGILLFPAFQSVAHEAKLAESKNKLREVAIAIEKYATTFQRFPAAFSAKDNGTILHSWRSQILPNLEQTALHNQITKGDAWNEKSNQFLFDVSLPEFNSFNHRNKAISNIVAVVDKGTVFDPTATKGVRMGSIDDPGNTIMLIEWPESDIRWFEPKDVTIAEAVDIIRDPSRNHGTLVAFADSTVDVIPNTIDEAVLRMMFQR